MSLLPLAPVSREVLFKRDHEMKKILATLCLLALFGGCNMSENKEARLQKLETSNDQMAAEIEALEARIEALESIR